MVEPLLIDLKALLVEREDCDAGTVQQLRNALAQGGTQFRTLREVTETLKKKLESASGAAAKRWHLKLGIALFFLGHTGEATEQLQQAEGALASFYLGRALASRQQFDDALKAYEKAEKSGYTGGQVQLQRAGIYRQKSELTQARNLLNKLEEMSSHSAEYHFQVASIHLAEGERTSAVRHLERAVELDPGHTGALFQLGHANDLAGNDDDAIQLYERCLKHPPVHVGALINLGVLYEDSEKFDKAVDCYRRVLGANPNDEQARLFFKDAHASLTMYYNPEEEHALSRFSQVLEIAVTDFELSVRSRNCLKKMNIRTLGDLTRVSEQQLLSSKNFGETSLTEIKEMLTGKGLRLGQSLEDGAQHDMRFRPQQPLSEQEQAVLNKPVSDLNLSVRARKCMNRLGINTLGELVQRSADELLESKNFGMTSLNEVREKLAQYGLSLRGDSAIRFEVLHTDGRARAGLLDTAHGRVETPVFMPVGTQGTVKGLTPRQLQEVGVQILLGNTYHLALRPGDELIAELGGLHRFMDWDRPILTDSGGYQVYSLASSRRIDDRAALFRSHIDGALIELSPEGAVAIQENLGSDIAMCLDECPPFGAPLESLREAVRRTVLWAERCRSADRRTDQALFGIVQGGADLELRGRCAEALAALDFPGYALGGFSVGETPEQMAAILPAAAALLPAERPRYLMGVGRPQDILAAVAAGIDMFDCVLPTRNGRNASAFTADGPLRLRNAGHKRDPAPLESGCSCYTCRHFSRAYLHHLFLADEMLGPTLLSLHNVAFYGRFLGEIREAIRAGRLAAFAAVSLARWEAKA